MSEASDRAILDPWKGSAFTAITGKHVYTRIGEAATARDREAYAFLEDGSRDTSFLRGNGLPIVYSRLPVDNPELIRVREHVYLLDDLDE